MVSAESGTDPLTAPLTYPGLPPRRPAVLVTDTAVLDVLPDDDGVAGTDAADPTLHEQDSQADVSSEVTTDAPVATTEHPNGNEHQNGSGPASTAEHTAQDERTAE